MGMLLREHAHFSFCLRPSMRVFRSLFILDVDTRPRRDHVELATRCFYRLLDKGRNLPLKHTPLKVAYYTPCHMEKMGWAAYSIELNKCIPGIELIR